MARYAVIDGTNTVTNVIKWDGNAPWSPPAGCIAVLSSTANIGCSYDPDSGEFGPTPPPDNGGE